MAITKRQIELEVRANNLSNKSMDEVIRNINELSEALEVQAKLAEQGQGSVDDLTKTYDKLSKAGNALVSQTGVIEQMGLLAQAVEKARDRVAKTTQTLDEYKASIAGIAKLTGEQSTQLARLEKAAKAAGTSLENQNKKFAKASENAERIGVNMDNFAQANDRVAESAKRLSTIQTKVTNNLDDYAAKIAKVAKDQDDLAASDLSLAKSREARAAAESKFNAERAASATKFREADYAKLFDELEAREIRAKKAIEAADRAQRELADAEKSTAAARAGEGADRAKFEAERAANLRKFKEADYARLFDEIARAEDHAAKETADLERELKKLGTTLDKATKDQKEFAKASVNAAKKAGEAGAASNSLLGGIGQLQKNLIGGERTSLGFFQRMRGEILSLIAAYAGFQGAVQLAAGALEAFRDKQATASKLLVTTGNDQGAATAEYEYLEGQAERLGIRLRDLAGDYSAFRIAAKEANVSLQDSRFIFESTAEAGRKLNLTQDNMKGIFNALTQLVSKGKASSEELRQQLGDRLPGVMAFAAKKFGVSVEEFSKQLELGNVNAVKAAIALSRGLNEAFSGVGTDLDKTLTGTEGRFQTALDNWKVSIAESGLVEAYQSLLKKVTEFLKSEEGREVAASIGKSFAAVADAISVLIDNIDVVKVVLAELLGLFGAFVAIRFAGWVMGVVGTLSTLTSTITLGVIPAVTALSLLLGALVLIPIAVWAYREFEGFRKAVDSVVLGLRALWEVVAFGARALATTVRTVLPEAFNYATKSIRETLAVMIDGLSKAAAAVGNKGLADSLMNVANMLRQGIKGETFISQITKDAATAKRELASLARLAGKKDGYHAEPKEGGVINPITGLPLVTKKKAAVGKTAESGLFGGDLGFEGNKDKAKQEAEKYANLLESLTNQVAGVTASAQKKDRENLSQHLAGIEKQYEGLFKKIGELNAKDSRLLTSQLRAAVDGLKQDVTKDYWEKQEKGLDAIKKKFAEMDLQLGKGGGEAGRAQIAAGIAEQFKQIRDEIEGLDLEKLGGLQRKMELLQSLGANERQTTERALNRDRLREAEEAAKAADNLIDARNTAIQDQQALVNRGLQTEAQMYEQVKATVEATQPTIAAATDEAIRLLEALRGADGIDTAALDARIAKLKEVQSGYMDIRTEIYSAADANQDLTDLGANAMDSLASNIADVSMGLKDASQGARDFGMSFAKMAGDFLRKIAMMIIQQQILKALQNSSFGGMISGAVGAGVNHEGGVVGSTGRSRTVSAGWFTNAPKYHTGGIAGLAPNEYPAILKKNEEVLTENDPRNILNGGMQGGQATQQVVQDVKVMNMIDSGSFVSEGMSTPQGVKAVLNFISANRSQVKSILG